MNIINYFNYFLYDNIILYLKYIEQYLKIIQEKLINFLVVIFLIKL